MHGRLASLLNLRAFSRACAVLAMLAGGAVLAGWISGVPALRAPAADFGQVKANAGLLFLLAGAALWLLDGENAPARRGGGALGAFIAFAPALVLSQDP